MSYWYIVQEGDLKILMDTKLVPSGFLIYSILGLVHTNSISHCDTRD